MPKDLSIISTAVDIPLENVGILSLTPLVFDVVAQKDIPDDASVWVNFKEIYDAKMSRVSANHVRILLPYSNIPKPIKTFSIKADLKVITGSSLSVSKDSVSGVDKIVQHIAKMLYSSSDSDIFTGFGLGLLNASTQRISDIGHIFASIKVAMDNFVEYYNSTAAPEDRILAIEVVNTSTAGSNFTATIRVSLANRPAAAFTIFTKGTA